MLALLERLDGPRLLEAAPRVTLGLHHEQQHQELMLMDIKHVFSQNPLSPVYAAQESGPGATVPALEWVPFPEGVYWIGHEGLGYAFESFAFDNEGPRHREFLQPFRLASRLTTNGDYLQFMADGGYERPEFWLSDGWATVQSQGWKTPLYWEHRGSRWVVMTRNALRTGNPDET